MEVGLWEGGCGSVQDFQYGSLSIVFIRVLFTAPFGNLLGAAGKSRKE